VLEWLAIDAENTFCNDFNEAITYTPFGSAPIELYGLIFRQPASAFSGLPGAAGYKHEIMLPVSCLNGLEVINKGKDTVAFSNKIGGKKETFTVMQILQTDQGIWHLGVG
jgi:hypothetical protein